MYSRTDATCRVCTPVVKTRPRSSRGLAPVCFALGIDLPDAVAGRERFRCEACGATFAIFTTMPIRLHPADCRE